MNPLNQTIQRALDGIQNSDIEIFNPNTKEPLNGNSTIDLTSFVDNRKSYPLEIDLKKLGKKSFTWPKNAVINIHGTSFKLRHEPYLYMNWFQGFKNVILGRVSSITVLDPNDKKNNIVLIKGKAAHMVTSGLGNDTYIDEGSGNTTYSFRVQHCFDRHFGQKAIKDQGGLNDEIEIFTYLDENEFKGIDLSKYVYLNHDGDQNIFLTFSCYKTSTVLQGKISLYGQAQKEKKYLVERLKLGQTTHDLVKLTKQLIDSGQQRLSVYELVNSKASLPQTVDINALLTLELNNIVSYANIETVAKSLIEFMALEDSLKTVATFGTDLTNTLLTKTLEILATQ